MFLKEGKILFYSLDYIQVIQFLMIRGKYLKQIFFHI